MQQEASSERPRRTQQERRDSTQRALLSATIAALVELGYRATTTLEVERRASVSRGARIHHFPNKAALLASAVDYLYEQLSDHYERAFGASVASKGASDLDRFRSGLRLLWSIYRRSDYVAVLELNVASRTDPELRERLVAVGERHRNLAIAAASHFFPQFDPQTAHALIETLHVSMLGLLMQRGVSQTDLAAELVLPTLDELAARYFEKAAAQHVTQHVTNQAAK